ncbi:MAG: YdcF family protein [Clostridia bacterium]|nr:YdcF family protein [Clostridia bacterium]
MIIRALSKIIGGAAGIVALSAGIYMPFVISDSLKKFNDDCDYLLILGGNVIGADTPSPQLFERMKAAANYLNEHKDVVAVPCGGCFRESQKKSEAEIIGDYLISQGVEPERIVLEDKSETTYQNFEFGVPIIKNHSGKKADELRIAFLSSDYHMHRAGIIAKQSGIKDVRRVSCPTPGSAIHRFGREYIVAFEMFYRTVKNKTK